MSEELCLPQITQDVLKIDCRRGGRKLAAHCRVNQRWMVSLGCGLSCRPKRIVRCSPGSFHPVCNMTRLGHWPSLTELAFSEMHYLKECRRGWSNFKVRVQSWFSAASEHQQSHFHKFVSCFICMHETQHGLLWTVFRNRWVIFSPWVIMNDL